MKLINLLRRGEKIGRRKKIQNETKDYRSELGKKQFEILVDRGLNVPVAYL